MIHRHYGFQPDLSVTPFRNAVRLHNSNMLHNLPIPSNLAFHDLTPTKCAPPAAKSLLGLGSKFIPTPSFTTCDKMMEKTVARFTRDFYIKVIYGNDESEEDALAWADHDTYRPKLYVKSKWNPTALDVPSWACNRLAKFVNRVERLFRKRKASSNLLPFQESLMKSLLDDENLFYPETDKGLGPCCVTRRQYVEDCLIHLRNKECYVQISEEEALLAVDVLETEITEWIERWKHSIDGMSLRFIENHMASVSASPFGQFYVLYKIHKGIGDDGRWPTRPVCSDVSSLAHGLGKWVNEELSPVAQAQESYFQDSFALKKLLDGIEVPPGALLFTADATAMYTNIKTEPALAEMAEYLREHKKDFSYPCEALIEALQIVFRNNYFKFGDTYNKQISGTAMGTPPAPPWATCTYGNYERTLIPRWKPRIPFYKRFIDDVLGMWLCHQDPKENDALYEQYKRELNGWNGLKWKCSKLSTSVNFMDLTISIVNGRLHTTIYEKEQNLYLYIPPHSSHPKGVLTGLIFGQVLRLRRLCSASTDADNKIQQFYERLRHRGHNDESLLPLFRRAEENAATYMSRSDEEKERLRKLKKIASNKQIYFHLQYHPEDPPSREIQKIWQEHVSHPSDDTPLHHCYNLEKRKVGFSKLVIAYSRPLNLKNRFSIRDIHGRGRPVSEYLAELEADSP